MAGVRAAPSLHPLGCRRTVTTRHFLGLSGGLLRVIRHREEELAHSACSDGATSTMLVHRAEGEQKKLETPRKSQFFQERDRSTSLMPVNSAHMTEVTLRCHDADPLHQVITVTLAL